MEAMREQALSLVKWLMTFSLTDYNGHLQLIQDIILSTFAQRGWYTAPYTVTRVWVTQDEIKRYASLIGFNRTSLIGHIQAGCGHAPDGSLVCDEKKKKTTKRKRGNEAHCNGDLNARAKSTVFALKVRKTGNLLPRL